jgi:hypothetical protein
MMQRLRCSGAGFAGAAEKVITSRESVGGIGGSGVAPPDVNQSMNFVGSTYTTGFMIAKGYFASFTVFP